MKSALLLLWYRVRRGSGWQRGLVIGLGAAMNAIAILDVDNNSQVTITGSSFIFNF